MKATCLLLMQNLFPVPERQNKNNNYKYVYAYNTKSHSMLSQLRKQNTKITFAGVHQQFDTQLHTYIIHSLIIPTNIPAANDVEGRYTGFTLSICLSVHPSFSSVDHPCLLCILNNTSWIHFKFTHVINQLQKMCSVLSFWKKTYIWNFADFFLFHNLTHHVLASSGFQDM